MAQFDICRMTGSGVLVVDCQSDLLDHIDSRFVVPLLPANQSPIPAKRLNPQFELNGETYTLLTQSASAVARRELGPVVASLAEHDREILNALDFLLTGV